MILFYWTKVLVYISSNCSILFISWNYFLKLISEFVIVCEIGWEYWFSAMIRKYMVVLAKNGILPESNSLKLELKGKNSNIIYLELYWNVGKNIVSGFTCCDLELLLFLWDWWSSWVSNCCLIADSDLLRSIMSS